MVTYKKHDDNEPEKGSDAPEEFEVRDPAEEKRVDVPVTPVEPDSTENK